MPVTRRPRETSEFGEKGTTKLSAVTVKENKTQASSQQASNKMRGKSGLKDIIKSENALNKTQMIHNGE